MKDLKRATPGQPIPARSNQAYEALVDLTDFYTTSLQDAWTGVADVSLASLPEGIHAFHRGAYDIRGLIQLAGKNTQQTGFDYPVAVKNIPVNYIADKIDFFQGALGKVATGTKIGTYTLNYVNGETQEVPIVYNRDVRDIAYPYDLQRPLELLSAQAVVAGKGVTLYTYTVNNPLPGVEIKSVDFQSEMTESAPFLVAMTMELFRTCMEHEWFDSIRIYNDIIPRSQDATANLIDLSDYYMASPDDDWFNHAGHDLHDLPKGVQEFCGVPFDVRGLMVLGGGKTSLRITGLALPEELRGIKIGQKGKTVNFLHACAFDSPRGTKVSDYIINYTNKEHITVPIEYGVHVMDWWERKEEGTVTVAKESWFGSNAASRRFGLRTRVVMYSWENPHPDWEIESIDWVSALANSAPILFAITVK